MIDPTTRDYLKRNARAKKEFAQILGTPVKNIQKLIDELLAISKANEGTITAAICEQWAADNPDSYAHSILNWDDTQENRIAFLDYVIQGLTFLLDPNGVIYFIEKQ